MKYQKYQEELFELLKIPTVSAQSEHNKDINEACEWLKKKLENLKFKVDIIKTNGHPIVYAENCEQEGKPTVLVYGHYDVQSPDPINEWSSKPFEPEIRSGNIYGRGTADDKGQLFTWVAAIEEIQKEGKLPINIKFVLEGEEEVGSENFKEFTKDNKSLLKADICVVSDSHCLSEDEPLICYGLRGLSYAQITVKTLPKDVHSGLYGGNVANPVMVLSHILAKLKDEEEMVHIPGFYDDVRILSKEEKEELAKFPFGVEQIIEETGAQKVHGREGFSVAERAGAQPTFEVNGIWGGYIQEGQKTIIPGQASAKISMRLVPDQDPDDIFEKFAKQVKSLCPEYAEIIVERMSTSYPVIMDRNSKYFKSAEKAYEKVFGQKPKYELSGGSIGAAANIKQVIGIDCILMGYGLPDDGLHSPNEKMSLNMFEKGIDTNIHFIKNLE